MPVCQQACHLRGQQVSPASLLCRQSACSCCSQQNVKDLDVGPLAGGVVELELVHLQLPVFQRAVLEGLHDALQDLLLLQTAGCSQLLDS